MSPEYENYFTCNLGQAAQYGIDPDFTNISDFIRRQARDHPALPALGYFTPDEAASLSPHIVTFEEVNDRCNIFAESILSNNNIPQGQVVALLLRNLPDFLFAFLALLKIGSPVLLIAPQCTPKASAQLCKQCNASVLLPHDSTAESIRELEEAASEVGYELKSYRLDIQRATTTAITRSSQASETPEDIAYLFHTSGTSTGIPKPIPQSHRAGAGVQHRFDGRNSATFTTTPLYHGGMADLFRAWTSDALIWLFPGEHLPITHKNVVQCLDIAHEATKRHEVPPIKFFSSVPYVLESMSSDSAALEYLLGMEIVGVGGAALPTEVGDELVRKGVKLISRFGSAECGFLMSSHRDYENDREWQFLRPGGSSQHLRFEPRDAGLYELIVLPSWPFMAKTTRDDGSFATSDLFERHDRIPDAWKYHSRADSQLTLVTGKKFDPAPVESALAASSPFIADVLVFGNDRPFPGALVFRSHESADFSDERLLDEIWPAMEKLNGESQSHTRIARSMLFPMPFDDKCLEKSSKGTIIRRRAEERYKRQIEQAYMHSVTFSDVADEEVAERIREMVQTTMESSNRQFNKVDDTTNLFAHGVDSIASIQIRSKLRGLLPKDAGPLPATIVEDSGTIEGLSKAIIGIRHGRQSEDEQTTTFEVMEQLVADHSILETPLAPSTGPELGQQRDDTRTILLTGSTGSLGCNLVFQLLSSSQVKHIHLLIRGPNPEESKQRLLDAFRSRCLEPPTDLDSKVSIHPFTLSDARLGLSKNAYDQLVTEVDLIIHLAWAVNFLTPLSGFRHHFSGLQTLLSLARAHSQFSTDEKGARLIFCSSTASVASFGNLKNGARTPEEIMADPQTSGPIGYSRSKWVAEGICAEVSRKYPELAGRIDVVRVGQVSGHSKNGVWNSSEAYPLLLSTARLIGCLPELQHEMLAWIPVDHAAAAFLQLAVAEHRQVSGEDDSNGATTTTTGVYHLLNSAPKTRWNSILRWLRQVEGFDIVPVQQWLDKLEELDSSSETSHPCLKLLNFWKGAYGAEGKDQDGAECSSNSSTDSYDGCEYVMEKSKTVMPILGDLKSLEKDYVLRLWEWIQGNVK